ncbi:twin-arginine translocase TatA/TatE family subunit [Rhodoligotrophos defluvii]|uniref:twin-arginine translocase TatA/TatE family subunit n=1 Tax=Rhodoligotrophos defluvii TaxID=2561934 RepID=UPI0010C9F31D|nr:twin-arginine translocase TatA/TatE family subunit [Rhodoligotrophos defluvii]
MGAMSAWHWIILGLVIVLLFGRGKVSELMGDVAKGIKSFKKGMAEDPDEKPADTGRLEHNAAADRTTVPADGVKTASRD